MNTIGVVTSGGDAPGMNAAIRAVVRKSIYNGMRVFGIKKGYQGLIHSEFIELSIRSVGDVLHRGGTILQTARSEEFKTPEGQKRALYNLRQQGIEGMVVIGGDGSFHGAKVLCEMGIPSVAIPTTIDNDIAYTDYSIGFDTALNTVLEVVNKVRDTATSHARTFVIEVMGREAGHIALFAGLASGAEYIIVPEIPYDIDLLCKKIQERHDRGKLHSIIIVAEGAASGHEIGYNIKIRTGIDTKVTTLGHIQRGGSPSAFDRVLASTLGGKAVELISRDVGGRMVGMMNGSIVDTELDKVLSVKKPLDMTLYELADVLSIWSDEKC